jgi:hypothetical protein
MYDSDMKEDLFQENSFNSTVAASSISDLDVNDMNEDDVDSMMNEDDFSL